MRFLAFVCIPEAKLNVVPFNIRILGPTESSSGNFGSPQIWGVFGDIYQVFFCHFMFFFICFGP